MVNLTLAEFIKKNEKMIFVLGIFLASVPLSFNTIKELNSTFAGYIAIAISVAVLLIIKNFLWGQKKELSFEAMIFVGCLATIAGVVVLITYQTYTDMTLSFFNIILTFLYFITGLIFAAKILERISEFTEKRKKDRFLFNLVMFILFIILASSNIDDILNSFLLSINFVIPPVLTIEYEGLFLTGIYFMIFIYGVFVSGLGYFGKEIFYDKVISKIWIKIKDNILFYKKRMWDR